MRLSRRALAAAGAVAILVVLAGVAVAAVGGSDDGDRPAQVRATGTMTTVAGSATAAGVVTNGGTSSGGGAAGGSSGDSGGAAATGAAGAQGSNATPAAKRKPGSRMTPRERADLVLQSTVDRQKTPTPVQEDQSSEVAVNSPSASALPGILRPCDQARGFTVYTLGERFDGKYASRLGAYCQDPPPVVGGKVAVPTRQNNTEVFYGPCRGGDALGCGYDVSVRSMPSCERPYSLYTAFTGPPGQETDGPKLITLRGVPAAEFDDRIELWTKDTAIVVFATPGLAREAVEALRPASEADDDAGAALPAPADDIVATKLTAVRCT